ncbi:hypothetical protein ACJMK2_007826 [Sinanodonta woodiana]|uniref:Uncharacterized protein n=1 Tax=Sinanodonta woodiana TaxID=1069815 RepID=A0ABD3VMN7_SINWO
MRSMIPSRRLFLRNIYNKIKMDINKIYPKNIKSLLDNRWVNVECKFSLILHYDIDSYTRVGTLRYFTKQGKNDEIIIDLTLQAFGLTDTGTEWHLLNQHRLVIAKPCNG